jgi:hypothetical protein
MLVIPVVYCASHPGADFLETPLLSTGTNARIFQKERTFFAEAPTDY